MTRSGIDRDSLEYLKTSVTTPDGVVITSQPVAMAVMATGAHPTSTDFKTAAWIGGNVARMLIGPGQAVVLTAGTYDVWVKVTDSPEIPILKTGSIVVT